MYYSFGVGECGRSSCSNLAQCLQDSFPNPLLIPNHPATSYALSLRTSLGPDMRVSQCRCQFICEFVI